MRKSVESIERFCERPLFCFLFILLVCIGSVVVPIHFGGLHASGDTSVYLGFSEELKAAYSSGRYLPGWADDNQGFGSVGIRFYPPLSIYTLSLLTAVIGDWYFAIWASYFLWMVVGCWGIYLCVKEWATPLQGVIAGALYGIVPFHIAEIYQFSLFAEFAAGAIFPYCLLFAVRIWNRNNWGDVAKLGISFGALVLTHIPTTIIGSITLGIFILLLIKRPVNAKALRFAAAFSLALCLSAFYWVKVANELPWLAHNDGRYAASMAGYVLNLFPLSIFEKGAPYYYASVFRNLDAIVVLTFVLFSPSILTVLLPRARQAITPEKQRLLRAVAISAAFGFFMLSEPSSFIWSALPILQKIQFPWRWLSVLSILAVIGFTISVSQILSWGSYYRTAALTFAVAMIVAITAYDVRQSFAKSNTVTRTEIQQMLDVRNMQAGSTFEAWWPIWARADALKHADRVNAGDREVRIVTWEAERRSFEIAEGQPTTLRIATFYYPHWRATVNGSNIEVGRDQNGTITIPIAGSASDVHLYFEESRVTLYSVWLSLGSFVLLLLALVLSRFMGPGQSPK